MNTISAGIPKSLIRRLISVLFIAINSEAASLPDNNKYMR